MAGRVYRGPKNTLLFQWTQEEYPVMERDIFAKEFLIDFVGLKLEEVLCLQDNPREKGYEVTFNEDSTRLRVFEFLRKESKKMDTEKLLNGLKVHQAVSMAHRAVTVHMYDPHVKEEDILVFLKRFGRLYTNGIKKVMDRTGFWTGKRIFHLELNPDPNGYDGLAHPPAFFTIGADRGYLSYYRQPPFCKKCRVSGHGEKDCGEGAICRFCSSKEHGTKDCPRPKECHACGSLGHLFKDCPGRAGAGGGNGHGRGAEASGRRERKETSLETPAARQGAKDGARTGSQAFNGAGAAKKTLGEKKVRTHKDTEEVMESDQRCEEVTGGGLEGERVSALSFESGQPACLFGPASPETEQGRTTPSYIK